MRKILIVEYERPVSELIRMNLAGAAGAYAQTVLLHYGESIKKAAKDLGFSSVYHFSNTFKRITGIRPTEYQEWKKL